MYVKLCSQIHCLRIIYGWIHPLVLACLCFRIRCWVAQIGVHIQRDLTTCSSLQVILVRGTIPAHIDQRGSGPNATLKSNFAKNNWSTWDNKKSATSIVIFLRFEVGGVPRKMDLVIGKSESRFLHRSFCAVLVCARKSRIFTHRNVFACITCIMRASEYVEIAAQIRVHIPKWVV